MSAVSKIANLSVAAVITFTAGAFNAYAGDCPPQDPKPALQAPGIVPGNNCSAPVGLGGFFNFTDIDPACRGTGVVHKETSEPFEFSDENTAAPIAPTVEAPKPKPAVKSTSCDFIS